MSAVFNALNPGEVEKVAGLFVSVDPERDTPIQVSEYAAFFDKRITGVTGSPDEVAAVARQFYVLYNKVDQPNSAIGYTIDHSASTYLIDKKGKVIQLIKHDESVQTMVQAVRDVLAR
jgi:protein SCO1/2